MWDLLKETPWKSFPFEFSAPTQGKKGFILQRGFFGWCIYIHVPKCLKNRSNASAFTEFLFLQNFDLSKLPIDSYRASPCDLGFSANLLLHYGWIEVEGVWCVKIAWMIKKAYFRWKWWLVTTRTPRNLMWLEPAKLPKPNRKGSNLPTTIFSGAFAVKLQGLNNWNHLERE